MSIITLEFLLFIFALIVVYYAVPKRFQWMVLLAASLFFYFITDKFNIVFILINSALVFVAAIMLEKLDDKQKQYLKANKETLTKEQKKQYKNSVSHRRRLLLVVTLIISVGTLCLFKYLHFAIDQVNVLCGIWGSSGIDDSGIKLIAPLGISFYTFQSIGYLVDVYWRKNCAERNFAKMLLFTSFFPQIIQGPISNFSQLSAELFAEHSFEYKNYAWGFQRIIWGLFKKMVIANTLAPMTRDVLINFSNYTGVSTFIGIMLYSIQLYADFSGYMDIVCGISEILGIRLTENFNRPFFSKSIAEFWRRWHISLGVWFKNYIFFPIAVSKPNTKLSAAVQKKFGKFAGQSIMSTIPLIAVWLLTGLWHGASTAYIVWGAMNGIVIIFSLWMEPVYKRAKSKMHIKDSNRIWRVFQMVRTFFIFAFIEVLPETKTLAEGFGMWKHTFAEHTIPSSFRQLLPFVTSDELICFCMAVAGIILLFAFSVIQRKQPIRELFNRLPLMVRISVLVLLFIVVASIGVRSSIGSGGFMYANF